MKPHTQITTDDVLDFAFSFAAENGAASFSLGDLSRRLLGTERPDYNARQYLRNRLNVLIDEGEIEKKRLGSRTIRYRAVESPTPDVASGPRLRVVSGSEYFAFGREVEDE